MRVLFLLFLFGMLSCDYFQPKEKPDALARVGDHYLLESELTNLGLENSSTEDSISLVDAYINNWIRKEAYLQYAKNQLDDNQLNEIAQKVEDYEQSLYTHIYESQMVAEKLDSIVSQEEIETYYNNYKKDYIINEPVLRFISLKKDNQFTDKKKVNELLDTYLNQGNDAEIREYCTYNVISCQLDAEQWVTEQKFLETFGSGFSINNINRNTNRLQQVENQDYYYLCKIIERKTTGYYPIEFVTEEIKKNIIRKREIAYIENLRSNIINLAKENNEIEIYESE